jgi:hypothetical protein
MNLHIDLGIPYVAPLCYVIYYAASFIFTVLLVVGQAVFIILLTPTYA